MQFSLPLASLHNPLEAVISVVDRNASLQITENILLRIKDNQLSVTATNLQVEMRCWQSLTVDLPDAAITLPGHKLESICKSFPNDAMLDCEIEEGVFTIRSGKFAGSLKTLPVDSFPLMEDTPGENQTSVHTEAESLYELMDKTSYAMALQDVRYFLNGMRVEITSEKISCIATDGHRMAMASLADDLNVSNPGNFTIPRRGVIELMKVLAKNSGNTELRVRSNNLYLKGGQLEFRCKLIEGEFPDYRGAIPTAPQNRMLIDNNQLITQIERAIILSNEKPRSLKLGFEHDKAALQTQNSLGEKAYDELAAEYTGRSNMVGFNADYLLAALRKIQTEKVVISFNEESESCRFEEDQGSDLLAVIMPMRV